MSVPNPKDLQTETDDELSLIDLWSIVWKRKWLWLTLGPLAGVIGMVIALRSTEIYRAEVLMAPAAEEKAGGGLAALAGQFGGLASMAGVNLNSGNDTATSIATLKSRKFLLPYLLEQDLFTTLFYRDWDPQDKRWTASSARRGLDGKPTESELYEKFVNEIITVSEDNKSGLVTLGIEWENPELASRWANEISSRINSHLKAKAKTETEKNLAYLKDQLNETQVIEIRESLYTLIESQTQNAMLANAKEEFAFRIIDPAFVPETRIRPKKVLIVISSGMFGGFIGVFLCFIFHFTETDKKKTRNANS